MSSITVADKGMVKVMGMVLGALVLFTLFCMLMARILGIGESDETSGIMRNALVQRIEPVGRVRTSADDLPDSQVAGAEGGDGEQVASAKTGEELVQGACASCHVAGVAGAPKLDDAGEWEKRREAGLDALIASVINGKGAMPARGASSYSDDEIKLAVQHIAGFEVDEPAGGDEQAAADGDAPAEGEGDQASADAAPAEGEDEQASADEAPAEGEAAEQASAEGGAEVDLIALIGSGDAPAGMSDGVKQTVDGICASCHMAGVANAPKLGDKEGWTPRAELGLAALTESVVNGKAAMPARGGSQLSDEEIPVAIQYLMSKSGS